MIKESVGQRVKELRLSKVNLSQEDFAKKIGFDRTFLSRIESGRQNMTIETLDIICKGLSITLSEFFRPFNTME